MLWALSLLAIIGASHGQIVVQDNGDGFTLSYNGLVLIEHSAVSPAFALASSINFVAEEDVGNYEITDEYTPPIVLDGYEIGGLIGVVSRERA